jgi:hypothetical protein
MFIILSTTQRHLFQILLYLAHKYFQLQAAVAQVQAVAEQEEL